MQVPRGTRDFIGREEKLRSYVISTLKQVFEQYGYEKVSTPAFEEFEVLAKKGSAGEEIQSEIYYFKDKSDRELGLRFDFTVPLARMIATNPALPKPFKRYQVGKVWRYDRPGKSRYREFTQADVDIIGVPTPNADAEILAIAVNGMLDLGFKGFCVRISSRKLAEGIVLEAKVKPSEVSKVFRAMDKLPKIGEEGVKDELRGIVSEKQLRFVLKSIKLGLKDLKKLLRNEVGQEGVKELEAILNYCGMYGIKKYVKVDPSIVRGLDYYTSFVMEIDAGSGTDVSVGGGGRYDNLIELYGGSKTPATGFCFGVDRLCDVLAEKFKEKRKGAYIALTDQKQELEKVGIGIASALRKKGEYVQINMLPRNLKKQIKYADKKNFEKVLIVGEKDLKDGVVTIRNLETGKEKKVKLAEL